MKSFMVVFVLSCIAFSATAMPQKVYVQKLPYYPPPTAPPRHIVAKRSPESGPGVPVVSTSSNTVSGNLAKGNFGTLDGKVSQSSTQYLNGAVKELSSGSINWSDGNRLSASLANDLNKGVSNTFSQSVTANLFKNDNNRLDATYAHSNINNFGGPKFETNSGRLGWSNAGGHGVDAAVNRVSGIGSQGSLTGHATLFETSDGNGKISAYGGASKWLNGPLQSRPTDFGFGLGGSYGFGR